MAGPFLFPDISAGDIKAPSFTALAAMPNVIGCVLKATDGTRYDSSWFIHNWPLLRAAGGSRTGASWFRGAYHFLRQAETGAQQAQVFLATLAAAGGLDDDDMMPIVDVEGAGAAGTAPDREWNPAIARQVATDFAAYVKGAIGRDCILYANGDTGIGPKDGFPVIWTPHPARLASWPAEQMAAFQYAGDGKYYNGGSLPATQRFPLNAPGWVTSNGKPGVDFSVVMNGLDFETDLSAARRKLTGASGFSWKTWGLVALGVAALGGVIYLGRREGRLPEARLLP